MARIDGNYWRPVFVTITRDGEVYCRVYACAFHQELSDQEALAKFKQFLNKNSDDWQDHRSTLRVTNVTDECAEHYPHEHDVLHISQGGCEAGQP